MPIKTSKLQKTPGQEPQTPYKARLKRIRRFLDEDEFLRAFFPQGHPLLVWERLHLSEPLTYRLRFR